MPDPKVGVRLGAVPLPTAVMFPPPPRVGVETGNVVNGTEPLGTITVLLMPLSGTAVGLGNEDIEKPPVLFPEPNVGVNPDAEPGGAGGVLFEP